MGLFFDESLDDIGGKTLVAGDYRQEPPFALQVELTEGCNLRCSFCGLNGIRGKDNDFKFMTMDTAHRVCHELEKTGWNPRVEFAMHGEPTMNPRAEEIVALFRQYLPSQNLMMTSNGGGLLKDPYGRITRLLRSLNVLALDWYENVQIVPKVLDALSGTEVSPRFYPKDLSANPHRRRPAGVHELVIIQDIKSATAGTHATLNNHCGAGSPKNDAAAGKRCAKPFREMSIRWDGAVAVCCNDWRGELPCGNVLELGLDGVWNGPAMRAVRRYLYHGMREVGPCRGCDALSYRVGLLPDKKGKVALPRPTPEDRRTLGLAMFEGPLALPVLRPWELEQDA